MPKRSAKPVKRKSAHEDYELPDEIDFEKTKFVGFGLDALERHAARRKVTVQLAPDVAAEFSSADQVNEALRLVKQLRRIGSVKTHKRKAG